MKLTKRQLRRIIGEASRNDMISIDEYLESIGFDVDPSMVDLLFVLKPFGFMVDDTTTKGKITFARPAKMHRGTGTMIFDDLDVYDSGEVDLLIRYPHSKYVGYKSLEQAAMELPAILQKEDAKRGPMAESLETSTERNKIKITKRQLRKIIKEELAVIKKDVIADTVMGVLDAEGGAAGLDPIESELEALENEEMELPEEPIEDLIASIPGVKRHAKGDYIDTTQLESRIFRITKGQIRKIVAEALGDRGDLPRKYQYKIGMRGPEDLPPGNFLGSDSRFGTVRNFIQTVIWPCYSEGMTAEECYKSALGAEEMRFLRKHKEDILKVNDNPEFVAYAYEVALMV